MEKRKSIVNFNINAKYAPIITYCISEFGVITSLW